MGYAEEGKQNKQFVCSDEKKNVFLIGDSIRMGYCQSVRQRLSDVAEVFYIAENCRSTQNVITNLYGWSNMFSDKSRVEQILFNCGHWDIAHWCGGALPLTSPQEYQRNLQIIIHMLQKLFPNAKLLLATTTPMNPSGQVGINPRTNQQIRQYNDLLKAVAMENGVDVVDLYAVAEPWESTSYKDYCHFVPEAYELLAEAVSETLREHL